MSEAGAGTTPVVFVHGLWLHADSWGAWIDLFRGAGYAPTAPGWPGDSGTIEETRRDSERVAGHGIDDVVEHYAGIIRGLDHAPVIMGHSFGGLVTEMLLDRGLGAAGVAISPAPFKGVLRLPPAQIKSAFPVLGNPANRSRAVPLTFDQFWTRTPPLNTGDSPG